MEDAAHRLASDGRKQALSGGGARLLLVDDDAVPRIVLARQLARRGFEVRQAASGAEALQLAGTGWPQALVLDYLMPDMDGLAVLQRLRADAATAELPILLLTTLDDPATLVDAFEQGVDDYVTKPGHPDEVSVRLIRLLRQAERRAHLTQAATVDPLTQLLNRRGLEEAGERLVASALAHGEALACLIFDFDHFKLVNDTYGHAAGDAVLAEASRRLRSCLRRDDAAGRYGGEEFVALLRGADVPAALEIAERIRHTVAATPVATAVGPVPITISGGGAVLGLAAGTWAALVAAADAALYRAKAAGRDRICFAPEPSEAATIGSHSAG